MIDIESVAKALNACKNTFVSCSECPYKTYRDSATGRYCISQLMEDALQAIRELNGKRN